MARVSIITSVAAFAAVAALLTVIPGMDTALVLRNAVLHGRRQGWAAALGITAGSVVWGFLAAAGISAVLASSRTAYDVLRIAGAAYMVWLGVGMVRRSWGPRKDAEPERPPPSTRPFRQGITSNLLNPKVGVFYVTILPQFIPADAPHLAVGMLLTLVHCAEGLLWFTLLIGSTRVLRRVVSLPSVQVVLDRITGAVIVGFGVRLLLT